ncbi:yjeF N-terminal domain-containing protein 3-like isoform X2 [Sinocyclocheilus anshuiensis]|uniref:yjeF N-terminal domain-containing protein 3-like isoform X2 n=1 Tax=Sinocyclocheilus anshuiensis TaxID=1608454 RepID=UPI0007BAD3CE|nr:PREDICTED: yjeF N-terminal domain-containing protein 3-like isoform X2 [Sinocyclocheilus anshuiensis]
MSSRIQESVRELRYLSKEEAVAMETELLRDYGFGRQQLTEMLGHACATAITQVFPLASLEKRQPTVLVACGPDQNGCVGLACARHLHVFEYIPTVFIPKRSSDALHQDLRLQCERMDLPFLSYLPTEVQLINEAYNLVVDAVLGPETELASVGEPFTGVLQTLRGLKAPIVSLDIPSGWDADESSSDGISPALLVSLMTPKRCSRSFSGSHFLAGRFLPFDLQRKYELNLPKFSGTDAVVQL